MSKVIKISACCLGRPTFTNNTKKVKSEKPKNMFINILSKFSELRGKNENK